MKIAWQVEIDPFCRRVLEKHWPHVPKYGDIREVKGSELEPVDLVAGGFPCQPFSYAGKRRGKEDDRYLWPEMLRIIKALKPRWVLGENVAGIVNLALDTVLSDLEGEGYETAMFIIPACAVGAPHRRDRVWIVAYFKTGEQEQSKHNNREEHQREAQIGHGVGTSRRGSAGDFAEGIERPSRTTPKVSKIMADTSGTRREEFDTSTVAKEQRYATRSSNKDNVAYPRSVLPQGQQNRQGQGEFRGEGWSDLESRLGGVLDELSHRMDRCRWPAPFGCEQYEWEPPRTVSEKLPYHRQRLQALGNAVVPQIPEIIGRAIMEVEKLFGGRTK